MKRKCFALLLVLTLCLTGMAAADGEWQGGAASSGKSWIASNYALVWNTDTLNLRAQGSSSSQWLGTYSRNTWVEILGSQNNFYQVRTPDGKVGYMSKNYLDVVGYYLNTVAIVDNPKATSFLNLRAYPSYSAKVLGILYNGVPLYVKGYADGWYQVIASEVEGYVRSEYVYTAEYPASGVIATIRTPNNTALNLRSGPGANYPVLRQFAGDRYVMVLAKGDYWFYVSIDGYVGFMATDYLADGLQSARDVAARQSEASGDGSAYAAVNNPISTQRLNLRASASTSAKVLAKLSNGTRLTINRLGTEWSEVYVPTLGATGYVMTQYLTLHNLPTYATQTVTHPNGSFVNLRQSPSLTAGVISRMSSGSIVTVIAPGSEWSLVSYAQWRGYVLNYFLK